MPTPSTPHSNEAPTKRIAVFAGSFDPFTIGHADIVRRALELFDRLVIVVAVNPQKHTMFTAEERRQAIERLYSDNHRVSVVESQGMTVDVAREHGARFIVRGVRSVLDFEYEKVEADYNRQLGGLETVLLYASPQLSSVSSTAYRTLKYFHRDREAEAMLPQPPSEVKP